MGMDLSEFSIDDIKNGYQYDKQKNEYICNSCGAKFYVGEIYKIGERFFDSHTAINIHISTEHGSVYNMLTEKENKYLGLTDNQKRIFDYINKGLTDNEIAKEMELSPSTIRHQKFMFREKAKQAKMYLALYELVMEGKSTNDTLVQIHDTATMVDDRYITTTEESNQILKNAFLSLEPLKLKAFPAKEKKKIIILKKITEQFDKGRRYPEKELNKILKSIFDDYPTIRRYLIEYGFMERTNDCMEYWVSSK
ncbi:MAG: transcriptional regulator [Anaerocolumna sp.]|jgi:hypothetical protein|nr:transcriptional regulator [Anaerocolumna sp.]